MNCDRQSHSSLQCSPLSWFILVAFFALGCFGDRGVELKSETLTVACATCIFHMPDTGGCVWAAKYKDKHFLVQGTLPFKHAMHAPDGMCNMERKAVVDGFLREGKLIASRFELLAAEKIPEKPTFTPEDIH
jgi:hypothetical protein